LTANEEAGIRSTLAARLPIKILNIKINVGTGSKHCMYANIRCSVKIITFDKELVFILMRLLLLLLQ